MGAKNSVPQTVEMDNPEVVHLTPSAIKRLKNLNTEAKEEGAKTEGCGCSCGSKETNVGSTKVENTKTEEDPHDMKGFLKKKTTELEEAQFVKTLEKLETLIGKPLNWSDEYSVELKLLETELIKCLKHHPRESLACANQATAYQNFIYQKQFESILRFLREQQQK